MTTQTKGLQAAIEWAQDQALTLPGMRQGVAPDYLEPKAAKFPFWAAFAGPGIWGSESFRMTKGLLSIIVELHISFTDLPSAVKDAMKYVEAYPKLILASGTMGGTVSARGDIDFSGLIGMKYASINTIGFRWLIKDIKIQS